MELIMFELQYARDEYEKTFRDNDNEYFPCAAEYRWLAYHIVTSIATADADTDQLEWLFEIVKDQIQTLDPSNYMLLAYTFSPKGVE